MNDTILAVEQLTVYREAYAAVQSVSFALETGTDTALVGPNGGGKTTLVQAILGILPHQAGDVFILGHPLSRRGVLPAHIRQQIAYLPQNFSFDRRIPITVEELVGLGWHQPGLQVPWAGYKARRRAVEAALEQVDAAHLKRQQIGGLSGGETKRVLLAYCLVSPRRLLILDEAPAGLDVRGESEFYELLYKLRKDQHWTVLQISHDLEMVRRHCDHVLCLNRRLLCSGSPEAALTTDTLLAAYGFEFVHYQHSH